MTESQREMDSTAEAHAYSDDDSEKKGDKSFVCNELEEDKKGQSLGQRIGNSPVMRIAAYLLPLFVGILGLVTNRTEQFWKHIFGSFAILCALFLLIRIIIMFCLKQDDELYRWLSWVFALGENKRYDIDVFKEEFSREKIEKSTIKEKYRLKKRILYYEYINREELYHAKGFLLEIKEDGVKYFKDRFVYSGKKELKPKKLFSGQEVSDPEKDHGWDFYTISLRNTAKRGECKGLGMQIPKINDSEHSAKPFLSTGIYEPTQELVMKVQFDSETADLVKDPYFLTFNDYVDTYPISYETLDVGVDNSITKRVSYPVYHYKYMILWRFEDG